MPFLISLKFVFTLTNDADHRPVGSNYRLGGGGGGHIKSNYRLGGGGGTHNFF